MKAFAIFWLGVWVLATIWLVVDLIADRQAHVPQATPCPYHRMETVSETALRAMLLEAMKARGIDLQQRS